MRKNIFTLLVFFILLVMDLSAMHPSVLNFDTKITKSGAQNWDIIQYQNDWMYFANNYGLLEYDGNKWAIYHTSNHTDVRSLCYDKESDRIYAGAFNEFGYFARDEKGILHYNSLIEQIKEDERAFNEIWNIDQADNTLYFQGDLEVFRYKNEQMKRFNFTNKINCAGIVHNLYIISVVNEGVYFLNGDILIPFPNTEVIKDKKVCAILPFDNNQILLVTDFHGLYIYDGEQIKKYETDIDDFLIKNQVFSAASSNSKLAFGTVRNGVVVLDVKTNKTVYSNISSGLLDNTVLSLAFDNQENLWLGLDKGIGYVLTNSPIYNLLGNNRIYGSGYTALVKDDILYLGTNQGLYTTSFPVKNSPELINVSLLPKMQGQIWNLSLVDNTVFCAADNGLYILEGKTARQIKGIQGTWKVKALDKHPGYIIGSSYQGFFILKKENGDWVLQNHIKGFTEASGMFEEDKNGNIWFSHWIKGVFKLKLNDALDQFVVVESIDTSKGFNTDRNNTLALINGEIVFSSDGGFFKYDAAADKIIHNEKFEELFGFHSYSMHLFESPEGDIWAVSKRFLDVALRQNEGLYNTGNPQFSRIKNKLLPGFEQFYFVDNENIIINTEEGFSWLNVADTISVETDSFRVSIKNVYLTSEQDSVVSGYLSVQSYTPEFKHKFNSVRFEFVAPDYIENGTVQYSYLLENYDNDWSSFSGTNTKEYTKLPKGTYTFKVRAKKNSSEIISETSYTFVILPAWYESRLAYAVYFILFMLLLMLAGNLIKKRSEKGIQEIKKQKDQEIKEQEEHFKRIEREKEKEIVELKNQQLQYDLRHKSRELASSTMNLIRKNEILFEINQDISKTIEDLNKNSESKSILKRLSVMQNNIKQNIERDDNWKKFEENFDIVYENYLKRLGEQFPSLTVSDKKLCAYLKMGLSSKDIAPLLNMSFRSVEMSRYRLRKKLDLTHDDNLTKFLQNF